jgi:hypothetical protein
MEVSAWGPSDLEDDEPVPKKAKPAADGSADDEDEASKAPRPITRLTLMHKQSASTETETRGKDEQRQRQAELKQPAPKRQRGRPRSAETTEECLPPTQQPRCCNYIERCTPLKVHAETLQAGMAGLCQALHQRADGAMACCFRPRDSQHGP